MLGAAAAVSARAGSAADVAISAMPASSVRRVALGSVSSFIASLIVIAGLCPAIQYPRMPVVGHTFGLLITRLGGS